MNSFEYCGLSVEQSLTSLRVTLKGLSLQEAEKRKKLSGANEIKSNNTSAVKILIRQFKSSFVYLLVAAAVLAFFLGERIDCVIIVMFISINSILGFIQEYRSEQAVKLLKKFIGGTAKVRREDKEMTIEATELVPGDILMLEPGDIVAADIRVVSLQGLTIDESLLTGESRDVRKTTETIKEKVDKIFEARNILFKGTTIKNGNAVGLVIATGKQTQIGSIAKLVQETDAPSTFEKTLNSFSKFILWLVIGTLIFLVALHMFIKPDTSNLVTLLIFAIALAVGVIPEGLPLVTTFSLSRGARRLAKQKVVVKRLSAIEDLGSIDVLCSDKTGTLTENNLTVSQTYVLDKQLMFFAGLGIENTHESRQLPNNSFDLAIFKQLDKDERENLLEYKMLSKISFDPERRRNSIAVVKGDQKPILVVRGAPEPIIENSKNVDGQMRKEMLAWITEAGTKGQRCLAVAVRKIGKNEQHTPNIELDDLELLGIIAFHDPLKETSRGAIAAANKLGVTVKIITGDGPAVSTAVGFESGVIQTGEQVISGDEFEKLSPAQRHKAVESHHVFARISPQQKYEIIKLLKVQHQVGYLGEGINDAPALKIANVALVVKGASDIAREAADIILMERNLKVIINGISEGRETFSNTIKYIKSTLLSNFGNFYALALSSLVIDYLPMLPVQILLVNLLSDFPMILISTDNVESDELRSPKSYDVKDIIIFSTIMGLVSTFFDFVMFGTFKNYGEGVLQTNWFIGSIITELLLIYSIRTRNILFLAKKGPSMPLLILTVLAMMATLVLPYTGFGQSIFHFHAPSATHMTILIGIIVTYIVTTEMVKLLYYKLIHPKSGWQLSLGK